MGGDLCVGVVLGVSVGVGLLVGVGVGVVADGGVVKYGNGKRPNIGGCQGEIAGLYVGVCVGVGGGS